MTPRTANLRCTQRIFWPQYNSQEKLDRLLRFLEQHRGLANEISFFTEGDGMDWRYLPPDEVLRRAEFLTQAISAARNAGFVPVINILNTLGHSDDGGPEAPVVPWQGIVGLDGRQARHCSCPADPEFLDYVRFKYEQFARCRADRYWVDDDFRIGNHNPVAWGCFCPQCVADFSLRAGQDFDRLSVTDALRTDRSIREAWNDRNGDIMLTLLTACLEGIQSGHPGAEVGLMTTDIIGLADVKVDFPRWFKKLKQISKARLWLRPGGGFWSDERPQSLLSKVHAVANTIDRLPPEIGVAYEVENYPFVLGSKSAAMTGLECLAATLGTRLEGIMFDVLDLAGNDPAPYGHWLSELEKWRPLWESAVELTQDTVPMGWRPIYSLRHFQQHAECRPPLEILSPDYQQPCSIQPAGVPITGFSNGALGHLLCGKAALGMSESELLALLERPLIMDADAAKRFLSLGHGEKIGITGIVERAEGAYERFTAHPLNGSSAGYIRAFTMKYFGLRSHAMELAEGTESLGMLLNYCGDVLGSSLTLYRPSGAAPVAVLGHAPWIHVLSPQRMRQLRLLSSEMLGGTPLPVRIESDQPVVFWYRADIANDRRLAVLLNPCFDRASVRLKTDADVIPTIATATPGVDLLSRTELVLPAWSIAVVRLS